MAFYFYLLLLLLLLLLFNDGLDFNGISNFQ